MGRIVKKCDKCGRFCVCSDEDYLIDGYQGCNGNMIDTGMIFDEYLVISKISQDNSFLEAMIELKQKDIIEFNLKMSQFKAQLAQEQSSKIQTSNKPKCPTCNSTNLKRISTTSKVASVALWGIFSQKAKKTWHCSKCGYEW